MLKQLYKKSFLLELLRQAIFFRRFEQQVQQCYTSQLFSGFCHLHIGQEGLCVGVQRAISDDDYMITGYRSHTQAIAKGISAYEVLCELFAKKEGCSKGKGGSMHMFSKIHKFYGGHGIVGGQVPLALGMAWKIKYKKQNNLVVCYLGDGAINQGQVMEAFNMASLWSLPVIFIVENNMYGMGTHINRVSSLNSDDLHKKALGFNMKYSRVDGQDILDVYEHTKSIVSDIYSHPKAHLLVADTYRYKGHSVSDPALYRTKKELESFREFKDPIKNLTEKILASNMSKKDDIDRIDLEVKKEIKQLITKAKNAQDPDLSEAYDHLYA